MLQGLGPIWPASPQAKELPLELSPLTPCGTFTSLASDWERSAEVQVVQAEGVEWTSLGCIGDKTERGTRPDTEGS